MRLCADIPDGHSVWVRFRLVSSGGIEIRQGGRNSESMLRLFSAIRDRWQGQSDGAGLAMVRILVALSVLVEMHRVWWGGGVTDLIVDPQIHFKYTLFPWVGPPQGMMPFVFVWVLAIVAAMVLVGWRTRWTASLMAAGYIYWFLIDAANYTDHGYLVCLLSILVAWLPTNRWASVDACMGRETRTQVPAWTVELVRTQISLVYFFFALSLLNSDWLNGAPLIAWAETETESPFGAVLAGRHGLVMAIAWLIPALYLAAIPGLCWKRTRPVALVALTLFHVWDALAFQLSVSPWLLTGINLVFCDTARLRRWGQAAVTAIPQWSALRLGWRLLCRLGLIVDRCVSWFDDTPLIGDAKSPTKAYVEPPKPVPPSEFPASARYLVTGWLILQCWLPVRYVTIEANPDWTDLATMFAWRGQHRDKQCELKMSVIQPSQELRWPLDPTDEFPVPQAIFYGEEELEKLGLSEGTLKDLVSGPEDTRSGRFAALKVSAADADRIMAHYRATIQLRLAPHQYEQLVQRPEFIRQYAQHIGAALSRLLQEEVQVHADLQVRLNHRPVQQMLNDDAELDLLAIPSTNALATRLGSLNSKLPAATERIVAAKDWAERRRIELEQDYDIVLEKNRNLGEPVKLPPLSDEDERWFQEKYGKSS